MERIKDIEEYRKLYLRGAITKQDLSKEYEKMVLATSVRVEKYMADITDSICNVALNTPSDLDEHAKQIASQLYIMWRFGLISFEDYFLETWCIEDLVKHIQSDYNNWKEQHKKHEK